MILSAIPGTLHFLDSLVEKRTKLTIGDSLGKSCLSDKQGKQYWFQAHLISIMLKMIRYTINAEGSSFFPRLLEVDFNEAMVNFMRKKI